MNEEILKQILQKLEYLESAMATKDDLALMATKVDLAVMSDKMATKEELAAIAANMATKEELAAITANMATKEELAAITANMATKKELAAITANMATKKELAAITANMATKDDLEATNENLAQIANVVASIAKKLDLTFEQVAKSAEAIHETAAAQEEHKSILEELSIRYFEQAAAIRRLNKKQADACQEPTPA